MTGKEAEDLFFKIASERGTPVLADKNQNMFEHWDVQVNGITYDVKTEKKLNRSDIDTCDVVWLELTNVRGNEGWLRGKAEKIAFYQDEAFYIVDREKLLAFTLNLVNSDVFYFTKQHAKWYRRRNRKDIITYVFFKEISHLVEEIWNCQKKS